MVPVWKFVASMRSIKGNYYGGCEAKMGLVNLTIDGQKVQVPEDSTILEAARQAGIKIPTLCYLKEINQLGACRVCLVEIEKVRGLKTACVYPVAEGMVVRTNTAEVREARKAVVELILSNHPFECLTCDRNTKCELQALAKQLGITDVRFQGENTVFKRDQSSAAIVRDPDKCVLCRRCVSVCQQIQGVGVLGTTERGFASIIAPPFQQLLNETDCVYCGQCVNVCPVGAITEKDDTDLVWAALQDSRRHVVVQTAPAVRAALGEEFGYPIGTSVTGQMVAALRKLGFDKVFDTDFTADLTIMEEGHEFLERLQTKGKLPLITSCSPGWINYLEHFYPELMSYVSTCKSPQQMFGALAKTYYAQKANLDPENIFVVSIMPCLAKKYECQRPEMQSSGFQDVDVVLSTRELAKMIKEVGLDFTSLPAEEYDEPLGDSSGAAIIFGASGGVMEAALRTVYEMVTARELKELDFKEVRGLEGIKEAALVLAGQKVRVAVANSLGKAKILLEEIKAGKSPYAFIEIMACPGGCLGGGGQPLGATDEIKEKRLQAIYQLDKEAKIRKSHENPAIIKLYEEYLDHLLEHEVHELLHTYYSRRKVYE